jgi:hypothetical protein
MPKFFLIIAALLIAFQHSALADDPYAECESYPNVPVHVTPRFDAPAYDYSQGIADITMLSSDAHHTIREALTLGLTRYEPMLEISVPIKGVQLPSGLACAHVDHVDVTLGYKDVTVFVAYEIPQGSCGFGQVMAHEQKHINVNMQILQEYTPRIEAELSDYLRMNGVFREQDIDYATAVLKEKLQTIIDSIVMEMSTDNIRRQQNVDTPAEYARVAASCNGQLHGVVAQFMQRKR